SNRNIKVEQHIEPCLVIAHEESIKQLVSNLIDNAIKYNFEEKPIKIKGHVTDNYYEIDRKSTRLNSSHVSTSYAVICLKKKAQHVASCPNSTEPGCQRGSRNKRARRVGSVWVLQVTSGSVRRVECGGHGVGYEWIVGRG